MYIKFNGTTIWADDGSFNHAQLQEEIDLDGRVHTIEEQGDRQLNLYRDTKYENKRYTLKIRLGASPRWSVAEIVKWWRDLHAGNIGEKQITRKMEGGKDLILTCVALTPDFTDVGNLYATVTQVYEAAVPFWRDSTETVETAIFDGTTPTTISFDNLGTVPSWVRLNYHGPLDDPEVAYSTEWEIAFVDLTLAGDDELDVSAQTPATVWWTVGGGAPVKAYGYRSEATNFRLAKLPLGSGVLDIVAGAASPELVTNPGFETAGAGPPTFLDWTELLTHGTVNDEGVDVHAGAHAARLDNTADGVSLYIFKTFVVVPGDIYTLSFWTHGDGVNDGCYGVRDLTNAAWIVNSTTRTTITGAAYAQITTTFTIPAGCISLRIYLVGTGVNAGSAYFDDVSMVARGQLELGYYNWYEAAI